jgi:hypothetical protein
MLKFPIVNTKENCLPALIAEYGIANLQFLRKTLDIDLFLHDKSVISSENYLGGIRKGVGDSMFYQLLEIKEYDIEMENVVVFEKFSGSSRTHALNPVKFHYDILNKEIQVFVETSDGLMKIDVSLVE